MIESIKHSINAVERVRPAELPSSFVVLPNLDERFQCRLVDAFKGKYYAAVRECPRNEKSPVYKVDILIDGAVRHIENTSTVFRETAEFTAVMVAAFGPGKYKAENL